MVLDSSAIVALVLNEPESPRLQRALQGASILVAGAPTVLESSMVLTRFLGSEGRRILSGLLEASEVDVISFTPAHAAAALDAFERFGKGRHLASLNFGDCMAYAIAKISGLPLLFTGSDFSRTDIAIAG